MWQIRFLNSHVNAIFVSTLKNFWQKRLIPNPNCKQPEKHFL